MCTFCVHLTKIKKVEVIKENFNIQFYMDAKKTELHAVHVKLVAIIL